MRINWLGCFVAVITIFFQANIQGASIAAECGNYKKRQGENYIENPSKRDSVHYNYGKGSNGPKSWRNYYHDCAGKSQSPVNIDLMHMKNSSYRPLVWKQYDKMPLSMKIINKGHTVALLPRYDVKAKPFVKHGALKKCYSLDHIHFHWGENDKVGSEHTINGEAFPMEMHAVHGLKDKCFDEAKHYSDGLLVIAYIYELEQECSNEPIQIISEHLREVTDQIDYPVNVTNFKISDLMIPFEKEYIYYKGSLTTPPCTENVQWIIAPHSLRITREQLEEFRKVFAKNENMKNLFRPIQLLNGRRLLLDV